MSILSVRHLSKSYRSRKVVSDLSLSIQSGETIGLLGPNGSGKTTSFNMIVGLVPSDGGTIHLDNNEYLYTILNELVPMKVPKK